MEKLITGFHTQPQLVERLFDRITNLRITMARRFVEAGVNVFRLGDDVGSQKGMLLSPETWRRLLKPRFAKIIEEARKVREDIPIFYHSDGDVREIVPELIEIGVTILNPAQAECMDPVEIKRKCGNRLALWGTTGTQTTMPFGTPEDVSLSVAKMCREVGKGGWSIIPPTHFLNEDVPWENIVAFYEAIEEFGAYQRGGKQ